MCLGQGNDDDTHPPPGRYTTISTGWARTCAVTAEHGDIVCWGDRRYDALPEVYPYSEGGSVYPVPEASRRALEQGR